MKERCAVFKVVFLKPCALKHSEYLHFHYLSGEAKVAVKSPVVFVHLVQVNFVHLIAEFSGFSLYKSFVARISNL